MSETTIIEDRIVQKVSELHQAISPLIPLVGQGESLYMDKNADTLALSAILKDAIDDDFSYDFTDPKDPFFDEDSDRFWKLTLKESDMKGAAFFFFFLEQAFKALDWRAANGSNFRMQPLLAEDDVIFNKEKGIVSLRVLIKYDISQSHRRNSTQGTMKGINMQYKEIKRERRSKKSSERRSAKSRHAADEKDADLAWDFVRACR